MNGNWINNTHLLNSLAQFGVILQSVSIGMGLALFFASVFKFKRYGEMRTFMSQQLSIAKPLLMLIGAIMLLILPVMIKTFLIATWGSSNPIHYTAGSDDTASLIPPIIDFVRIIGVCAFMRAIILFSRGGSEQSQPGLMSKAILHAIGGMLCINIVGTYQLISNIFNFS